MVLCAVRQHLLRGSRGAWARFLQRQSRGCVYSSVHGFQLEEIREKLQAFPGGSIELLKQESGLAVLTINYPSRMNAFSGSMMVDLEERVSQLEGWTDGKGLIVQGASGTFCSGSDLNAVRALSDPQDGMKMCMFMQNTLTRLLRIMSSVQAAYDLCCSGGGESSGRGCRTHHCLRFQVNGTWQCDPVCT
ncbi:ethylmalonyl-CoA decarboxylase isoform X2 [Notothenia coriiceps]|uniref:Ethylmalonyl-CoA decarboxylase isoform X2 n=1 Tax=Notothenia coriiceps TaxID=8208 RepID=A0A6I9NSG5_9TELE|nr:PREDICTED: ethylmalonyl-CoA decarboxylase isoform X2 [Notothenia coriiceps]